MPSRRFDGETASVKNLVSIYESDFGVCRIVMSRWVPKGVIMFLDSSRNRSLSPSRSHGNLAKHDNLVPGTRYWVLGDTIRLCRIGRL